LIQPELFNNLPGMRPRLVSQAIDGIMAESKNYKFDCKTAELPAMAKVNRASITAFFAPVCT